MDDTTDTGGPALDPFGAVIARAELAEVSERRAVRTAASEAGTQYSNIELARRLAWRLSEAAKQVGVNCNNYGWDLEGLAGEIVRAAQGGGRLSASDYRAVYTIWTIFHRQSLRLQERAAADETGAKTASSPT